MTSRIRYLVPNLFTAINFMLGMYAILAAASFTSGPPQSAWTLFGLHPLLGAAWMIVWCNLLDKLDGMAARMLQAFSGFGAQFDSLADLIAFGAAPGFLVFFYLRHKAPVWFGENLWLLLTAVSLYVLCAAIRLARYNAMDADELSGVFRGMPSTFAGGLIALGVILFDKYGVAARFAGGGYLLPLFLIILGLFMISPFYFPKITRRKTKMLNLVQLAALLSGYVCGFGMIFPEYMFALLLAYGAGGFTYAFIHRAEYGAGRASEAKDPG